MIGALLASGLPSGGTPHAGEFARLAGAPPGDDRVGACRQLADALGATVLLKGNVTVIADPGGARHHDPDESGVSQHREHAARGA